MSENGSRDSRSRKTKSDEYVAQVTAVGPLGLEYVNPKDHTRNSDSGVERGGYQWKMTIDSLGRNSLTANSC